MIEDGRTVWGHVRRHGRRVAGSAVLAALLCATGAAPAAARWTPARPIAPGITPQAVSCPTSSFCMTVGLGGEASRWDGTGWTAPQVVDPGGATLTSVSCPGAGECFAVDASGNALHFAAGTWSAPVAVIPGQRLASISCASRSFCVTVGGHLSAVHTGAGWGPPTPADLGGGLTSVSCTSSAFCAAGDDYGNAITFDGLHWTLPGRIDEWPLAGLSCARSGACAAVDTVGRALLGSGHQWVGPSQISDPGDSLTSVSCPEASFCMAVATFNSGVNDFAPGSAWRWNGVAWEGTTVDQHALLGVSCSSPQFCIAVDVRGGYIRWNGGRVAALTARAGASARPRR